MAFDNFQALLRQGASEPQSVASVVAAHAILSLALTRLAYPDFQSLKLKRDEHGILVAPAGQGRVDFYVESVIGDDVHFVVGPEDFDVSRHEQHAEFRAYRAFVDDLRGLPINTETDEGLTIIGPFSIYCAAQDIPKWAAIWEFWDHAHGE